MSSPLVSLVLYSFSFFHIFAGGRWDFGEFFVVKESLALMFKALQLPAEALLKYQVRRDFAIAWGFVDEYNTPSPSLCGCGCGDGCVSYDITLNRTQ